MNMFKKNGGFTLVELIVVIAILAILAGVAVPAYTGYMTRAKEAALITELDAIKTATQATLATKGDITQITVTTSKITAAYTDLTGGTASAEMVGNTDFELFYDAGIPADVANYTTVQWNAVAGNNGTPAAGWTLTAK